MAGPSVADASGLKKIEQEIEVLKRQVLALRRDYQQQQEWLDTVNSPIYKRVWWFLSGWRFYRLGRWYGN